MSDGAVAHYKCNIQSHTMRPRVINSGPPYIYYKFWNILYLFQFGTK